MTTLPLPLVKTKADKNVTENANHRTEYTYMDTEKNITVKSNCLACCNLRTILSRQAVDKNGML